MEVLLISACLLGVSCRYDGKSKPLSDGKFLRLWKKYTLVPVCPEQLGGLTTPRSPAEHVGDRVLTQSGADVTEQYNRGARETLRLARIFGAKKALLKARSPACGCDEIYDGTFTGTLTHGSGTAAELLRKKGIAVYTEEEIDRLLFETT